MPPLRVERFSHSGRPQGSPLRRFSAAIQNGASGRPRPTKGESLQSGRVRTPAPTADAEASCPFVGAGHWPARGRDFAISEPTLIRLAYARHLLPRREKAFRRLIAAPAVRRKPAGAHIMRPSSYTPGALARQTQAHKWDRTSGNFCKPRARWPGRNCEKPLKFCAPEIFAHPKGEPP